MSVAITLPTSSIQYRRAFHSASKETNESVTEWYHRLTELAQQCDYGGYLEVLVLDKLVLGLDEADVDRLCTNYANLSVKNVIEFCHHSYRETDNCFVDVVSAFLAIKFNDRID